MSFYQNKFWWIAIAVIVPLLMLGINFGVKVKTSVYKTDFGNGMVIYADDYVNSGRWVFDCRYTRLISRERLPPPLEELSVMEAVPIGKMHFMDNLEAAFTKKAIEAITAKPGWYKNLQYVYSSLGEFTGIQRHKFFLVVDYAGHQWAVEVSQKLWSNGKYRFDLGGRRYDPETYVDYHKAFNAAVASCPGPQ